MIAYENIRFSSLSAAGDVSLGGTSATLEPHDYRIYYVNIDLRHQLVWNYCRWVADVPPRETPPAARTGAPNGDIVQNHLT